MKQFLKKHGIPMLIAVVIGALIMIPFYAVIFSGEIR